MPYHSASLIPRIGNNFIFIKEQRLNKFTNSYEVKIHMFGGKMENNESPKECAIREFNEEFFKINNEWSNMMKTKIRDMLLEIEMNILIHRTNEVKELDHIFFTFDVMSIQNKGLRNFFLNLYKYFKPNGKVLSIYNYTLEDRINNCSSLTEDYIRNIIN